MGKHGAQESCIKYLVVPATLQEETEQPSIPFVFLAVAAHVQKMSLSICNKPSWLGAGLVFSSWSLGYSKRSGSRGSLTRLAWQHIAHQCCWQVVQLECPEVSMPGTIRLHPRPTWRPCSVHNLKSVWCIGVMKLQRVRVSKGKITES